MQRNATSILQMHVSNSIIHSLYRSVRRGTREMCTMNLNCNILVTSKSAIDLRPNLRLHLHKGENIPYKQSVPFTN